MDLSKYRRPTVFVAVDMESALVASTSMARQWGVPGEKALTRAPVIGTSIKKPPTLRAIDISTLYD